MHKRAMRWEPGQTLIGCSICGFPVLWPSECKRLDDGHFYCFRHVEYETGVTALADSKRTSEAMKRHDSDLPVIPAPRVSWR